MTVRWRLAVLAIQAMVLLVGAKLAVGEWIPAETWFMAGLLSVVINPQLVEHFHLRPQDVLINSVIALALYATTARERVPEAWAAFAIVAAFFGVLALVALLLGANREEGRGVGLARGAKNLAEIATSRVIFSSVFFLALVEDFAVADSSFIDMAITWAVVMLLGRANWQAVWSGVTGKPAPATIEGLTGPSTLFVTSPHLPPPGGSVLIRASEQETEATVITRIRRHGDTWGQLLVPDATAAEALLGQAAVTVVDLTRTSSFLGSAGKGSTDRQLRFVSTQQVEVTQSVAVEGGASSAPILYQISSATLDEKSIKGGGQLVTAVTAEQVGVFDPATLRLSRHRWVPPPGAPVTIAPKHNASTLKAPPKTWVHVGDVVGTSVPVFLDLEEACSGHLAVLGMTKMGKSTLAVRLIENLGKSRRVVVLDQTGEYISKHKLPPYDVADSWEEPGASVKESTIDDVGPVVALDFLNKIVEQAGAEYSKGEPTPRTVLIEEAHQFLPEPTGLGFKALGYSESYELGVLVMQIRKYGLSMILISQRTAVIAKSALSQCENVIAFRSVDQTGLNYLEEMAGSDIRRMLPPLRQGEAVLIGPAFSSEAPVAVKVRQ